MVVGFGRSGELDPFETVVVLSLYAIFEGLIETGVCVRVRGRTRTGKVITLLVELDAFLRASRNNTSFQLHDIFYSAKSGVTVKGEQKIRAGRDVIFEVRRSEGAVLHKLKLYINLMLHRRDGKTRRGCPVITFLYYAVYLPPALQLLAPFQTKT